MLILITFTLEAVYKAMVKTAVLLGNNASFSLLYSLISKINACNVIS